MEILASPALANVWQRPQIKSLDIEHYTKSSTVGPNAESDANPGGFASG